MTEKLANLSWQNVLIICAVLLVVRFVLGKYKNEFAKTVAEIAESLAIAMILVFFIIRPFLIQAFFIPSASMHPTLLEDDHIIVNKFIYRFSEPKRGDIVVFKAPPEADTYHVERDFIKRCVAVPGDTIEVKGGVFKIGGQTYFNRAKDIEPMLIDQFTEQEKRRLPSIMETGGPDLRVKYLPGNKGISAGGKTFTREHLAKIFDAQPSEITIIPGKTLINGKVAKMDYVAEDPDYDLPPTKIKPGYIYMLGDNRNNSRDSHYWGALERKRVLGKAMFIFWPLNRIRLVH